MTSRALRVWADLLVGALPLLATVALYLPSGVWMPFRWVTALLLVVALMLVSRSGERPPRFPGFTVLALATSMLVFGAIGMLRYRSMTTPVDALYGAFLVGPALALCVLGSRIRTVSVLVWSWVASSVLAGTVGIWEAVTGHHLPRNAPAQQFSGKIEGWNQASSFFDNPNLYAFHLGVTILLLPIAFWSTRRAWRWLVFPYGLAVLALLVQTGARLVLAGVALGLCAWALRKPAGRVLLSAGVVVSGAAYLAEVPLAANVAYGIHNAFLEFSQVGASSWVRLELARSGWWILQQTSFWGAGPGGFANWSILPEDPYRYEQLNNPHSSLVELGVDYGPVTLAVLVALLMLAAMRGLHASLRRGSALDRAIAFAATVQAITFPFLTASHSTWVRQPVAAIHLATAVALTTYTSVRQEELRGHDADSG